MKDYSTDAVRDYFYGANSNSQFVVQYVNKKLKTRIIVLQPGKLPKPIVVTIKKGRMFVNSLGITMHNNQRCLQFYYNIFHPLYDVSFVIFQHNKIIYKVPYAVFMQKSYSIDTGMTIEKKLYTPIDSLREYVL